MGKDKSKKNHKTAGPDKLAKTKKKGSVQLTEEDMRKVSGGATQFIKISGT
jgi:hypothetical protein